MRLFLISLFIFSLFGLVPDSLLAQDFTVSWYEGEPFTSDSTVCDWTWESWSDTLNVHCSVDHDTGQTHYNIWFRDNGVGQLPDLLRIFKSGWDTEPPYCDQFEGDEGVIEIQDWYPDSLFSGYINVEWDPWFFEDDFFFLTSWGQEFDGCFTDSDCEYEHQCCLPIHNGDCTNEWGGWCYDWCDDPEFNCWTEEMLELSPVCGCDGSTYENWCVANLLAIEPIDYNGECLVDDECYMAYDCPHDVWPWSHCIPDYQDCGFETGPGFCIEMDQDCYFNFDPVCGCDGVTYQNGYIATSWFGQGIQNTGLCQTRTTYHVSTTGSYDIADGSPEFPFREIQYGIEVAVDGDTVLVHTGAYVENINLLGKAILLKSVEGPDSTVINPEGDIAITFNTGESLSTIVDGFTVTGGNSFGYGAGISCFDASPELRNLVIYENSGWTSGAIYLENSAAILRNCLVHNNSAEGQSALRCVSSQPQIENCTFTENLSFYGGTLSFEDETNAVMINTIIWNSDLIPVSVDGSSTLTVSYSDMQWDLWEGEGNISTDPQFVNPEELDFRLSQLSPCIDSGASWYPVDTDCSNIDMGALPYNHCYYQMGDVIADLNGDLATDILDVIMMVNCILDNEIDQQTCICADLNEDCILDILDVVRLVNIILEG